MFYYQNCHLGFHYYPHQTVKPISNYIETIQTYIKLYYVKQPPLFTGTYLRHPATTAPQQGWIQISWQRIPGIHEVQLVEGGVGWLRWHHWGGGKTMGKPWENAD